MNAVINILVSQILNINSEDHKEVQLWLRKIFRDLGYFVELEKKIQAKRPGRIELFAKKGNFSVGIEIDHSVIRWKSIDKLSALKPSLAIFVLKSKKVSVSHIHSRSKLIKTKSLIAYLSEKKYETINKEG